MTFVLKDFATLKKYFDDTIDLFLEHNKIDTISEIPSPRKDQLLFLQHVLEYIQPIANNAEHTECYYAAMLVVKKDIEDNISPLRGETPERSKLLQRLNECLNITEKNQPELKQYSTWHKELNELLRNALFISKDSRHGLSKDHLFTDIEQSKFIKLIKLNYEMEEAVSKSSLLGLPATGKSTVNLLTFKPSHADSALNQEVVKKFGSFDEFARKLNKMIIIYQSKRNTGTVSGLSKDRSPQMDFLLRIKGSLESIKPLETKNSKNAKEAGFQDFHKTAILAGAMHIIRAQITQSYHLDSIAIDDTSSYVHEQLTGLLNIKSESPENIYLLVFAANEYIQHLIVETTANKVQLRATHLLFSSKNEFDLPKIADTIFAVFKSCHNKILDNAFNAACLKEPSTSVTSTSFMSYIPSLSFGSFLTSSKQSTTVKPTEDEDELSHDTQESKETEDAAASSSMKL